MTKRIVYWLRHNRFSQVFSLTLTPKDEKPSVAKLMTSGDRWDSVAEVVTALEADWYIEVK